MSHFRFLGVFFVVLLLTVLGYSGVFQADQPVPEILQQVSVEKEKPSVPTLDFLTSDFDEPFLPTIKGADKTALAAVLERYKNDERIKLRKVDLLEAFLQEHPESPWAPSVRVNLGTHYHRVGRFTRSLDHLNKAWNRLKTEADPRLKALADKALGEYAITLAHLGRMEELEPLLASVKDRPLRGAATEMLASANEGLLTMETRPEVAFLCGPSALRRIGEREESWNEDSQQTVLSLPSTQQGTSLLQNRDLSKQLGLNYQMAYREPGSEILTPAVVHWKAGHFAALLQAKDDLYLVEDDTAGMSRETLLTTREALEEEFSGYFLIPEGPLPDGWRSVSEEEGKTIWGRGNTGDVKDGDGNGDGDNTVPSAPPTCFNGKGAGAPGPDGSDAPGAPGGPPGFLGGAAGGASAGDPGRGMTVWDAHVMLVSLRLKDTPVGLSPAAFAVPFTVTYSQREMNQPAVFDYANLGPKWTNNWTSFVTDRRSLNNTAKIYKPGGGADEYTFAAGATESERGTFSLALLSEVSDGFRLDYNTGAYQEYRQLIGSRYHLTAMADPHGNTVNLEYDGSGRLSIIRDAVGREMTLAYEHTSDPMKITGVTDPFGRSASFSYTADGHLESITDTIGLVSSYEYENDDFINTLTTPYGTTTFTYGDVTTDPDLGFMRFLEVVDAEGRKHRVEYDNDVARPGEPTPEGMPAQNGFLNWRTCHYWAPHQLDATPDYSKATAYHFLHTNTNPFGLSRVPESIKKPLENRVWYAYDRNPFPRVLTTGRQLPTHIGRVLADGTTQLTKHEYDDNGKRIQTTDPMGRVFDYTYAANGIDLESVSRGGAILFSAVYDSNHNITTLSDSSGGVTTYTYNGRGQVATVTNPLGETTINTYTATGNLATVEAPLQATTTFTYDSAERVRSVTDSEGYTAQVDYDNLDRPTTATYPDGTFDTITYNRLDVVSTKDRIDRETQMSYDNLGRVTQITDANGEITGIGYGLEDSPNSLTDPNGNTTAFQYDLQGRLAAKIYADGASQTTTYEPCCSRVSTVTDALGNSKTYTYFQDNQVKNIDYSGSTPDVTFTNDTFLPRPLSMTDGQGLTTMTYVPVGSPGGNQLATISGPFGDTASFTYDIAGRAASSTINGSVQSVIYDPLWRPSSTTNELDTFAMTYLGKTGQVTSSSSSLGPTMQYTYDTNLNDRRLIQIKNLSNSGDPLSQFDYAYDPIGQITRLTKTFGDGNGGGGGTDTTLTASQDSILRAQKPHRNEGANPLLMLSHRPEILNKSNNPIVDFDLSNIDVNNVTSAKLVFHIKDCDIPKRWGKNGRFIVAQPVTEPWVEGNGKRLRVPKGERTRGTGEGVTWFSPIDDNISNKKPNGTVEWDGARTSLGPVTAPAVNVVNNQLGPIEFDVTQDVQSGYQNGWILRKQNEAKFGNIRFYSKEGATEAGDPELAPKLVLEFGQNASSNVDGALNAVSAQMLDVLNNIWGWDTSNWNDEPESDEPETSDLAAAAVTNSTETLDFTYDNLSQLVGVDINQTPHASYQIDPAGNLSSVTIDGVTTNLSYNNLNQTTGPGAEIYDAKGQTTELDGRIIEWDEQGRAIAITQGTQRSEFGYDGLSRRTIIKELENGTVTSEKLYWWLGGTLVCERDGLQPGFPITKRYFGQGVVDNGEKLFYTTDHLGSVRELSNENGDVVAEYRYSIYGERTKVSGAQDSDFGFGGLFHHAPSGLDLATYRLYDPESRRFISRDPLGESVDYNLYRYARNNPVNLIDPEGLSPGGRGAPHYVKADRVLVLPMPSLPFGWGQLKRCKLLRKACLGNISTCNIPGTFKIPKQRIGVAKNNCRWIYDRCKEKTLLPGLYNIYLGRRHPEFYFELSRAEKVEVRPGEYVNLLKGKKSGDNIRLY